MTMKLENKEMKIEKLNKVGWFIQCGKAEGREEVEALVDQFKTKVDLTAYTIKWISNGDFRNSPVFGV